LAALSLVLEFSGDVAVLGEDGSSVTEGVVVHKIDSLLKGVDTNDNHDGSENFMIIDIHARLNVINNGGANEITILEAWNFNATAIEEDLSLLSSRLNKSLNSLL
jgi:hypothetical protein